MSLTYGCKVPRLTRPGFERKRLLTTSRLRFYHCGPMKAALVLMAFCLSLVTALVAQPRSIWEPEVLAFVLSAAEMRA